MSSFLGNGEIDRLMLMTYPGAGGEGKSVERTSLGAASPSLQRMLHSLYTPLQSALNSANG